MLTQTLADIEVGLGDAAKARMAIGNINNELVLRLKDSETAKQFSESLPEVMIKRMQVAYQQNVGHNPLDKFGGRYGENVAEDYFPIIPAWATGILPDMHYFANLKGGALLKGRLPKYYKFDFMEKELNKQALDCYRQLYEDLFQLYTVFQKKP